MICKMILNNFLLHRDKIEIKKIIFQIFFCNHLKIKKKVYLLIILKMIRQINLNILGRRVIYQYNKCKINNKKAQIKNSYNKKI